MAQRDFLFSASKDDVALTRLIATAATATGFMKGAPGGPLPGWHVPGEDNRDFLRAMHGRLAASYPHAGEPYYAARMWNNLTWQPAYLAVIGVHLHGAVPALSGLAQARQNLDIDGFRLLPGPQFSGSVEEMINRAGSELRSMSGIMLAELNGVTKLKSLPARRLLADRMLGLMVRLRHFCPAIGVAEQKRFCALWLAATGLTGQGDLDVLDLSDGRQVAISARKGCCLDYLAFPGTYCSSCPKQGDEVRRSRQMADAIAELGPG